VSTEPPYPGPSIGEATITYSMKEVIVEINRKLDLLPGLVVDVAAVKDDNAKLEARVLVLEAKADAQDQRADQQSGAALFKDKFMAKLIGLAGLMGVMAGITVSVIQLFR